MNVISYFQSIPNSDFSQQSEELIEVYKQSWIKHGWNPIVLNEEYSKRNELFYKLDLDNSDANFYKTISSSMWKYHRSCYCRLLAYCQYVRENGSTLYSDYDVINYGFTSDILNSTKENSYFCRERAVVYLGKEGVMDIEQAILQFNNQPFREGSERGSCNDMNIMNKYTNCFNFQKDQNNQNYVSSIMPDLSNQTPLVHYDGGCYRRGVDRKFSRLDIIKQYHKFSQQ
jgi:hypothetical protein